MTWFSHGKSQGILKTKPNQKTPNLLKVISKSSNFTGYKVTHKNQLHFYIYPKNAHMGSKLKC